MANIFVKEPTQEDIDSISPEDYFVSMEDLTYSNEDIVIFVPDMDIKGNFERIGLNMIEEGNSALDFIKDEDRNMILDKLIERVESLKY